MSTTAYEAIARFYDLDQGGYQEDLEFYLAFARRCGSPLLELGCGTGRLMAPLAAAGYQITGVDNSPAMLRLACQRLEGLPSSQVPLVEADMRYLALGSSFALIIVALDTFMHLTTPQDQVQALQAAHRHLDQEGRLIIDLTNPEAAGLAERDPDLVLDWVRPDPTTGHLVARLLSRRVDPALQLQHLTIFYDETDPTGALRRTIVQLDLRYVYRYEMELLLYGCGFEVERVYGSYALEECQEGSPRLIFVARKAYHREPQTLGPQSHQGTQ